MPEKAIKVDKWDTNATKNALDDGFKKVLKEQYKFEEKFSLIDGRLLISTISVLCGGVAVLFDWLYPFPASKLVLIICVLLYFILTGLLTCYIMFMERSTFFLAHEKDSAGIDKPIKWNFQSRMKKYQDKYELNVTREDLNTKQVAHMTEKRSIADFFDVKGNLRMDLLEKYVSMLKANLETKKTN